MKKERITITLSTDILKKVDALIDNKNIRNRSHAIEDLLIKSLGIGEIKSAFILAGGNLVNFGGKKIPKALIEIHNKPVLEHQINMLKRNHVKDLIISIDDKNKVVEDIFRDGSKFGVNIQYVFEDSPLGTAGPLKLIKNLIDDTFVMINVDTLVNPDIKKIYEFHKNQNTLATILLTTVDNPSQYGVVRMDGNQILEFAEKPKKAPTKLINCGFHIFEPEVIDFVPEGKFMIEDLFKKLVEKNQLSGFPFDGTVIDVGTVDGYKKAVKEWKDI